MIPITKWLTSLRTFLARRKRPRKPVVLTPLSFDSGKSQVVGIFIRDPDTYEIVAQAFDRVTFAEKAGLPPPRTGLRDLGRLPPRRQGSCRGTKACRKPGALRQWTRKQGLGTPDEYPDHPVLPSPTPRRG